jgi:hypothetical protein
MIGGKKISIVRFSLRSLFVLITAICVFMGYELDWIRRRRSFLHEQFEKNSDLWSFSSNWSRRDSDGHGHSPEWYCYSNKPAPYLLWLFNEKALPHMELMLAESDVTPNKDAITDSKYAPYIISRKQPALRRVIRLFPESEIQPYAADASGVVHPAAVVD